MDGACWLVFYLSRRLCAHFVSLMCFCVLQVVKVLNLEEGGAFTVSSADTIMEALA